jgi:peptidoglycan hydrolase CwlO-like protein
VKVLEDEIKKLKETLEQKDEEIKNILETKTELEVKFEKLDNEVKDYLST